MVMKLYDNVYGVLNTAVFGYLSQVRHELFIDCSLEILSKRN